MSSVTLKIRKASSSEKEENYCGGGTGSKWCKKTVKYRWTGGYYYCSKHHKIELEELESSSEEESETDSEYESETASETASETDSESDW